MRLFDLILTAPQSEVDQAYHGAFSLFAAELAHQHPKVWNIEEYLPKPNQDIPTQCFELSQNITEACENVCHSKPSTILASLSRLRLPYPKTWIEWFPKDRSLVDNGKNIPKRMGCLLIAGKTFQKGVAIFAWAHTDDVINLSLDPYALAFDFTDGAEPVVEQYAKMHNLTLPVHRKFDDKDHYRDQLIRDMNWKQFADNDKEIDAFIGLEKRSTAIPNPYCMKLLLSDQKTYGPGGAGFKTFMNDLGGELPFVQAFLLMLGSRNTVIEQKKEDFAKLNKARAKARKPPVQEFFTTRLCLSKTQQNRAASLGIGRAQAEAHSVRGHFKVRGVNVFWWSPHVRGKGSLISRQKYEVV